MGRKESNQTKTKQTKKKQKKQATLISILTKGEVGAVCLSPPVKVFLLNVPRRLFFCGSFVLFMFRVYNAFSPVHCSLVVTCWEKADLLALLYVMFYCVYVTFICGVLG